MYNKPYEKELKKYSPESVKEGLKGSPHKGTVENEKLRPFSQPEIPEGD